MIRRIVVAVAVAVMAFSMEAAFAGGANAQYVRIKNIGTAPVLVNAANGAELTTAGGKQLSQNGVAQFGLKKGAGTAGAANPNVTLGKSAAALLPYNFPNSKFVYIQAALNGAVPTIKFAPPGTIF